MPGTRLTTTGCPNQLWLARKRAGLPQKRVAALLGKRSLSVVSEYEKGSKLPSLEAALKLEIIYQTPLSQLFPALYSLLSTDVASAERVVERPQSFSHA